MFVGADPGLLPVGGRIDGSYTQFSPKTGTGHDNLWSATANLVFKMRAPIVQPYIIGGVGYYYSDVSASAFADAVSLRASCAFRNSFACSASFGITTC